MSNHLVRQLGAARGSLTKTCNKIFDAQRSNTFNKADVTIWKNTLVSQNNRLEELNKQILKELEDSDEKLEDESEKIEEYCTKAFECIAIADILIKESTSTNQDQSFRLPKIQLPKFDGNVLLWQEFFETFKVSVDQQNISDIEKFQYLKSSLGGEAAATITGMPITCANYKSALDILKNRYGSTKRVLRAHVRALLALTTPNIKSSMSLRSFIDAIHRHMRGLEGLNVVQDNYEIFLCEILLIKVPNEIKHEWARLHEDKMDLKQLIMILENEAKHQEILLSTKSDILTNQHTQPVNSSLKISNLNRSLFVQGTCLFCQSAEHSTFSCNEFLDLKPKQRFNMVKEHKLCINCLRKHNIKDCLSKSRCKLCSGKHNTLLHFDTKQSNHAETKACVAQSHQNTILPTITVPVIGKQGIMHVGILLDSGSDRSFLSSRILSKLDTKSVGTENLNIKSFNGPSISETCPVVQASVLLADHSTMSINLLVSKQMNQMANHAAIPHDIIQDYSHLPICNPATEIDAIIGSDNFYKIATGNIYHVSENLKLMETIFGWTYHGFFRSSIANLQKTSVLFTSCAKIDDKFDVKLFWDDQLAGILPETEIDNHNDLVSKFIRDIRYSGDRYEIKFPWLNETSHLSSYKQQALARLTQTTRKLTRSKLVQEYDAILMDYKAKNIIEECHDQPIDSVRYIPHHPVVKQTRETTKIRIVFDASARDTQDQSINNCLFEGTNLFPEILGILLRFRLRKYAFTGDIEKAFLQIKINPEDRDFTRFLWHEDVSNAASKVKEYRFCRVPFGFKSSPFILNQVIQTHLNYCKPLYPETIDAIKENIYVDDIICSVESEETLFQIVRETKAIFSSMSMNMHKLHSNAPNFKQDSTVCGILGIQWQIEMDTLSINFPSKSPITTKRQLASVLCSVFDPLGLYLPFVNSLKSLLHKSWLLKLEWDEQLPTEITSFLSDFDKDIESLSKHSIERWFQYDTGCNNIEIHAFSDASLEIYCAALYLTFNQNEKYVSNLLCAKSRLAPKRQSNTVPRLELLGALIASRLVHKVSNILSLINSPVKCYTDSQVVLSWIKSNTTNKQPFIQRRVDEIRRLTSPSQWYYIQSKNNPADLGTRTMKLNSWLNNRMWWHGPDSSIIIQNEKEQTSSTYSKSNSELEHETIFELPTQTVVSQQFEQIIEVTRFSTLNKLLRTMAIILKFCKISTLPETCLLRLMQQQSFQHEINTLKSGQCVGKHSTLFKLQPFLDSNSILRVGGRLMESNASYDLKHPIILDRNHHFTKLVIQNIHVHNLHAGVSTLTNLIRQKYWVTQCRRTCIKILRNCVKCQRYTAKPYVEAFDQLPQERIRAFAMRPFQFVGVDYLGPISTLASGNKVYILLFTCMQVRAVHLEVTLSLAYDEFCCAFSRFTSRRGFPTQVRSDNAKTFKSAANKLSVIHNFVWKFNCEKSPWEGGCWERLVRSVKIALRQSITNIRPQFQDLVTLVYHVESIINNRPITYCTGNENEILPLSPINFLIPSGSVSTSSEISAQASNIRQALSCNNLAVSRFWKRWKSEFLPLLNSNSGTVPKYTIQVGDVMLLNEAPKRQHWPLVRIIDLIRGRDGKTRSARIKYKGKVFVRPLKLLHRLEIQES